MGLGLALGLGLGLGFGLGLGLAHRRERERAAGEQLDLEVAGGHGLRGDERYGGTLLTAGARLTSRAGVASHVGGQAARAVRMDGERPGGWGIAARAMRVDGAAVPGGSGRE